jgi:hypothetical protein
MKNLGDFPVPKSILFHQLIHEPAPGRQLRDGAVDPLAYLGSHQEFFGSRRSPYAGNVQLVEIVVVMKPGTPEVVDAQVTDRDVQIYPEIVDPGKCLSFFPQRHEDVLDDFLCRFAGFHERVGKVKKVIIEMQKQPFERLLVP